MSERKIRDMSLSIGYTKAQFEKFVSHSPPRPRGWPGKMRPCEDCIHKPKDLTRYSRVECEAGENVDDAAPCPEFEKTKLKRFGDWLKGK